MSETVVVEAGSKGAFARCPECDWREGPFTHPAHASDALLKHVNQKHTALLAFLRQMPLPSGNEGFARANVVSLMAHAGRLDKAINSPIASGPIDVPTEMVAFMRSMPKALASVLDLILEMRTGRTELVPQKKSEMTDQGKGA